MRILAVAIVLCLVRPADACGFWKMTDTERGLTIGWLINAASIAKGDKRVAALYLDTEHKAGLRVTLGKKVIYDIAGDTIRRYGTPIGKVGKDGTVAFGKHAYAIELTAPHVDHGMRTWTLAVRQGDRTIIEAEQASALCAAMDLGDDASAELEIRRRVAFYLAWRETGF